MELIHNGHFYKGVTKDRMGPHYPDKPYNVGTVHRADVSTDLSLDCAPGIHVCLTIAEALRWGPVVVKVGVPEAQNERLVRRRHWNAGTFYRSTRIARQRPVDDIEFLCLNGPHLVQKPVK